MRTLAAALLTIVPLSDPATAETPLTADQFDAITHGRTLYFYSDGVAYGAERYRDNKRVTWTFLDGECKEGSWYQDGRFICFVYDESPVPQCWTFFEKGDGLRALFEDDPGATELYEAGEAEEPLYCLGPEIGV